MILPNAEGCCVCVDDLYSVYKIIGYFLPQGESPEHLLAKISKRSRNQIVSFVRAIVQSTQMKLPVTNPRWPPPAMWLFQNTSHNNFVRRITGFWHTHKLREGSLLSWALIPSMSLVHQSRYTLVLNNPFFVLEVLQNPVICNSHKELFNLFWSKTPV
jgi:hypothetical protein